MQCFMNLHIPHSRVISSLEMRKSVLKCIHVFFDFTLNVKAAPHECVIRTGQA